MHAGDRQQAILRHLREQETLRVTEFAAELGVAAVTIRKDVEVLAQRGLLVRVHGGAMLPGALESQAATTPERREPVEHELTLGMVVPTLGYYHHEVIKGAQQAANELGAQLLVHASGYDPATERDLTARLLDQGVDGLLLTPSPGGADTKVAAEPWRSGLDVPVVFVERAVGTDDETSEFVMSDHVAGARMATRHLVALGRRRIALVVRDTTPTVPWIEEGYRSVLAEAGLERPTDLPYIVVSVEPPDHPEHTRPMAEFVDTVAAGKVDAAILHPEVEALNLLRWHTSRGLRVPEDLAIVSYDDEVAAIADVPLTSVAPPKHEVGYSAVELLLARIRHPERPPRRIRVMPELKIRSSAPAA